MTGEVLHAPIEVTKTAAERAAAAGGYLVKGVGRVILRRFVPQTVSPEVLERQQALKQFEGKFGIVSLVETDTSLKELEAYARWTAHAMVGEGVIERGTKVELRSLLPEESLYDERANLRRRKSLDFLAGLLNDNYGIEAIPNYHPIMPTKREDLEVDPATTWEAISEELDGFARQMGKKHDVAALAVTGSSYAWTIFGDQIIFEGRRLEMHEPLILRHVGRHPRENVLLGPARHYEDTLS